MAGKFELRKFSEINLDDSFFDELKRDYPGTVSSTGFEQWFARKSQEGKTALVFSDEDGLGAFICIKNEEETLKLQEKELPAIPRIKISTLRIAKRYRGQRLGEGALGLVLWKWQKSMCDEIYVTVFSHHDDLIMQLEKFGFVFQGYNVDNECVYSRSKKYIDFATPYKAFPFINPNFQKSGYLIVDDLYHDTLFPYSELKNTLQTGVAMNVTNGLSKIYVGKQYTPPHYKIGEPILIYRKYNGTGQKCYKSCLTSFCIVTDVIQVKQYNQKKILFDDFIKIIGNKSVFDINELKSKYDNDKNLIIVEMLYCGYFGEGHNVNMNWLKNNDLWSSDGSYPTSLQLSPEQFKTILTKGNIDVNNIIIN